MKPSLVKKWSHSLIGNVILFELSLGIALFIGMCWLSYTEGTLTPAWGLWIAFVCAIVGGLGGVFMWYTFTNPLIKRLGKKIVD